MKKLLVTFVIAGIFSANAFASDDGFYAGVQGGYGNIGYDKHDLTPSSTSIMYLLNSDLVNSNNIGDTYDIQKANLSTTSVQTSLSSNDNYAGRLFLGYQFNPYIAVEAGYTKYFEQIGTLSNFVDAGQIGTGYAFGPINHTNATSNINVTNRISENVVDLAAKIIYPIPNSQFNIYTKVGAAYVIADVSSTVQKITVNAQDMNSSQINTSSNDIQSGANPGIRSEICPEISPGVSYDINNHLSAEVSWTFIKGIDKVQNINFAGAGLTYHFS